jgi:PAS domain S-box-containing protein
MSERILILLVDDDEVDRRAVRRALRTAEIVADVDEADSVARALGLLAERRYDAIFLDFQLPDGDGLRVLEEAGRMGVTAPIIVLTGQGDDEVAVSMMKAGASDYLAKGSLTPDRLHRTLVGSLRIHQAEEVARQAESALRESDARFRVLHETSPDGFMIFRAVRDEGGRMIDAVWEYANPASEQISARSAMDLMGKRMLEVMPGIAESGLFDLYCEVVESGEPRQVELHYDQGGYDVWLRITAAKLEDGFAVSFTDISRRKVAEEERERALAARSRFFTAMSHEIRTPMNAILGYTDLLLLGAYGELAPKQREGIERTHRAAHHLLELVNDVLDLSKLEAGKLEIQVEPVDLPRLVGELMTTVQPLAEERLTELRFTHENCRDPIYTDPRRLRQILLNLLSNAIKFGRGQPVTIDCRPTNGEVAIEVADQGIGIALEDQPRIFEEFVQLSETGERGTGLGLPISKRLSEILGGRLEVQSNPGEGSVFRVVLPVRITEGRTTVTLAPEE